MTWPPGVWCSLIIGCLLIGTRAERRSRALCLGSTVLALVGWAVSLWVWPSEWNSAWQTGWWAAGGWWLSTAWMTQLLPDGRCRWSPQACGWSLLVFAGLLLAATARDWITLVLALELVRRGTLLREPSSPEPTHREPSSASGSSAAVWESLCLVMLVLAVGGHLLVTGGVTFADWRQVLQQSYAVSETVATIGRPSLWLTAATGLTAFAITLPVLWTWRWPSPVNDTAPSDLKCCSQLSAVAARQLASLLAISAIWQEPAPGTETPMLIVTWLITAAAWIVAWRRLTDPQRFDHALSGLMLWQWGCLLIWTCTGQGQATLSETTGALVLSLSPRTAFPGALLMFAITPAALAAATIRLIPQLSGGWYWDQFRGRGTATPWSARALWISFASLVGVPGLAGFWLRIAWLLSLFGLHQVSPDAIPLPHGILLLALTLGLILLSVATSTLLYLTRFLWLEPELGTATPPTHPWPSTILLITTTLLLLTGLLPQLLVWL